MSLSKGEVIKKQDYSSGMVLKSAKCWCEDGFSECGFYVGLQPHPRHPVTRSVGWLGSNITDCVCACCMARVLTSESLIIRHTRTSWAYTWTVNFAFVEIEEAKCTTFLPVTTWSSEGVSASALKSQRWRLSVFFLFLGIRSFASPAHYQTSGLVNFCRFSVNWRWKVCRNTADYRRPRSDV